jgi:pSer/pThr/pTyr-binding forkhead associated (FHA) protein
MPPPPPIPPDDPLLGANAFERDDERPAPPKVQRTPTRKERVVLPGSPPNVKRKPTAVEKPPLAPDAEETAPAFRPRQRPPMALLMIFDDGRHSGQEVRIRGDVTTIGRTQGDLVIPHDERMSGRHAEIRRINEDGNWKWLLADLGSTNGTFVRVHKCSIRSGQELMIGHRRFRFEDVSNGPAAEPSDHKRTATWAAPVVTAALVELTSQNDGHRYPVSGADQWIGRSADCAVPLDDPMIADHHARLTRDERGWRLESHEARDGIWLRIDKPVPVDRSCAFQLGEQRFLLKVL